MSPQFEQHATQPKLKYVVPLIPALAGAVVLMGVFAPMTQASPIDCQVADLSRGSVREGGIGWKTTSLAILPLTSYIQQDHYRDLLPGPLLETLPLRNTHFQRIVSLDSCWKPASRKISRANQALIIGKSSSKAIQVMRVPAHQYSGKGQSLRARAILREMTQPSFEGNQEIIGPVQDNVSVIHSSLLGPGLAIARSSTTITLPLFEAGSIGTTGTPKTSFRLPATESLRMNMTTTQALHGGNCASGCP